MLGILPRERRSQLAVPPNSHHIVALLLAAGLSTRARPRNKLLAPVPNGAKACPIVRASAEALIASYAEPVIVVTGFQSSAIKHALADVDVTFTYNHDFKAGMAGSLATGINAIPPAAEAAIVALGDMPNLLPETVNSLIAAFAPSIGRTICIPVQENRRGNPILFGRDHFAELSDLSGDRGGKAVVEKNSASIAEVFVDDPGIHLDFDTV